jgi:tetratricopeptide (TPR) repeat protein/tRNA A-37 threonylcarbamoyl transferase component Bud32
MDTKRLDSLLLDWQDQLAQGRDVSPGELCRDCPELAEELGKRIHALRHMNDLVQTDDGDLATKKHFAKGDENDTARSRGESGYTSARPVDSVPGYEILGELGRGGMGVVYKARQENLNRTVALKMILAGTHAGASAMARFFKEAETIANLKHPNVVQVHEFGSHGGMPYFSLEYLEGGNLADKIKGEPQDPLQAARTVQTLARTMQAAHDQGIVHRDLKPANVLLDRDGTPKITDFGLAKQGDSAMTATGEIMGTPSYMAPEQAEGKIKEIGPAADVYALGAILYDLLTGRPPFKGTSAWETLQMVIGGEAVPPSKLQLKVPRDLETICLKCLQKDPAKRYGSAQDLAEDLRRFLDGEPIRARPVGRSERLWRWCRRKPLVAGLAASLVLVLTGSFIGVTFLWLQAEEQWDAAVKAQKRSDELKKIADEKSRLAGIEADNAKREANKALRTAQVLVDMFQAADPLGLGGIPALQPPGGAKLSALEILRGGAKKVLKDLNDEPDTQAKLLDTIGNVFVTLGQPEDARPVLEKALALRRKLLPAEHPDLAATLHNLGWLHQQIGDYVSSNRFYREALAIRRKHAKDDPFAMSATLFNLGWLLADLHDNAAAEKMFQEVIDVRVACLGANHRDTAVARIGLAAVYINDGKILQAIVPYQQAMAAIRTIEGGKGLAESVDLFQKAIIGRDLPVLVRKTLLGLKDDRDVEKCFEDSLALARKTLGKEHVYVALVLHELGLTLMRHHKDFEAETHFRECLRIAREYGLDHPKTTILLRHFCILLNRNGKQAEARELLEEALAVRQKRHPKGHASVADVLALQGRSREALTMYCQFPGAYPGYAESCLSMLAPTLQATELVDLACQFARAAGQRQGDERDRFFNLAMTALRRAKGNGFREVERLQHKDLDGLRGRKDFQKLVAEMQASSGK